MDRLVLALILICLSLPILAQTPDSLKTADIQIPAYLLAKQMAKADAHGSLLYFVGGAGLGVYGILLAALSSPDADPIVLQKLAEEHGDTFALLYADNYTREGRQKNIIYAGTGFVVTIAAFVVILSYSMRFEEDYTNKSIDNMFPDTRVLPIYAIPLN